MALPLDEANKIAREINKSFGGWGWWAKVVGSENEVVVRSVEGDGIRFGFAWRLKDFTEIVKSWSVTFLILEGKAALIIW